MASFVLVTALLVAITAALCYRYRTKANPTTGLWYLGGVLCASFCVFALIPPGSREGDR